ncbi:MAG TPA: hypothetical protein VHO69_07035 [Phototrophicaceae bacterium]|nr:hypothetical protein [Phototrophicaceae bacterium]
MDTNTLNNVLLVGFALLCVLPLIVFAGLGVLLLIFGRRAWQTFFSADVAQLHRRYERLRAANPRATTDQLVQQMIRRQAFRAGMVGAITGLGGFFTLPIALPIDVLLSLRLQSALVDFIAQLYGQGQVSETEQRLRSYLVMSGGRKVSEAASEAAMKFLLRLVGKSFAKLIPFIGAAISFAVNYGTAQAIGQLAARRYSTRAMQPGA